MEGHTGARLSPILHPKPKPSVRSTKPPTNMNTLSHSYETMQSPVGISKYKPQSVPSQNSFNSPKRSQTSDGQADIGYPDENAILSLSELVEQCSHLMPLRVKAVSGFMAENVGDPTIHVDDVYNVHAVKQTEVATIVDSRRNKYRLPLHSSARFGLIGTLSRPCSVIDLLNVKPQPLIVAVSDNYLGHSSEFSLCKNEVLILNGVLQKSAGFRTIEAFSITNSQHKFITDKCDVLFSTDPADTKLYLSEILEHASHLLPCSARLFTSEEQMKLPKHQVLTKKPVTIEKQQTETSLLISFHSNRKRNDPVYIDIPTSIDIDVHVLTPSKDEEDYLSLYEDTQTLVYEYDPTKLQACVNANDDDTYMTQAQLLKALRHGYETVGTKIKTAGIERDGHIYEELSRSTREGASIYQGVTFPPNLSQARSGVPQPAIRTTERKKAPPFKQPDVLKQVAPLAETYTQSDKRDHKLRRRQAPVVPPSTSFMPSSETVGTKAPPTLVPRRNQGMTSPTSDIKTNRAPSPSVPPLPVKNTNTRPSVLPKSKPLSQNTFKVQKSTVTVAESVQKQSASSTVKEPVSTVRSEKAEYDSTLKAINDSLRLLIGKVDNIEEKQSLFEREISQLKVHGAAKVKGGLPLQVSAMTQHDVQNLLDAMDMSQYKEAFSKEWVDGEVFSELDEHALENDLGVTSKLHRIKLMKVITGAYPLEMFSK